MAEKLEDLNLPNASVAKIIKEALPEHFSVGKDARTALSKAASVFVLFITSQASSEALKASRKTLTGKDVLAALKELEFDNFVEPLEEALKEFKEEKAKKISKPKKSTEVLHTTAEETEMDVDKLIETTEEDPNL